MFSRIYLSVLNNRRRADDAVSVAKLAPPDAEAVNTPQLHGPFCLPVKPGVLLSTTGLVLT